jgi:Domain of unknown function (DUF5666)
MRRLFLLFPVVLLVSLLAACGSASTNASGSTTGATKAPTTNCLTVTSGTIQHVSNGSLLLTNLQGKNVQVTLTSATTYIRQSTLMPSGIKTGAPISVVVVLNADNTYSAVSVSIRSSLSRQGGFTSGARLCSGQGQFPRRSGTPGAFRTPGASGSGQIRQTVNGTVSQVNSNTLILTDTSGNNLSVTLTATTRITTQETVPVNDLRSGVAVTITGTANSQGVISANSVSILQGLPIRRPTATPTANA